MSDENTKPARRELTDYERGEMMKYEACVRCNGPRTGHLTASVVNNPPRELSDIELRTVMACLWCGSEA